MSERNEYTVFCSTGGGCDDPTWIGHVEEIDLGSALATAREDCARDTGLDADDIQPVGIMDGHHEALWDDGGLEL